MNKNLFPLIVKADISSFQADVIVYSTGCFLDPGFLTNSLKKRYGDTLQDFLREEFQVKRRPQGLPPKHKRTANDIKPKEMGGLEQGFTSFIAKERLANLKGASSNIQNLVLAVVGGEYPGHINPHSITLLVNNIYETLSKFFSKDSPKIVAFPTFGIGRGGVGDDRIPPLRAQIEAMNRCQELYPHIKPVLVTYSETTHRLALAARELFFENIYDTEIFSNKNNNIIKKLQNELESNRLVLFAGAGVSYNSGLPNWKELIQKLSIKSEVSYLENDDLLDIAEKIRMKVGKRFGAMVKDVLFNIQKEPIPSITHYLLSSLPLTNIVTTNYDDLIEAAYRQTKQITFVINHPKDVAHAPTTDQVNILKIHGDIHAPNEIVLTRSDYEKYFEKRPAVSSLLKGLLLNRTFLFIGYSLNDPNLHVILDEVTSLLEGARRKAYAIVFEATNESIEKYAQKGVEVLHIGGEDFEERNVRLWQFLDLLQLKHFAPYKAWLANDATELLPKKQKKLDKLLGDLQHVIIELTKELGKGKEKIPTEIADFLFPWLILATRSGLKLDSHLWKRLAEHYYKMENRSESTMIQALTAAVLALQSTSGRKEHGYTNLLDEIRSQLFHY